MLIKQKIICSSNEDTYSYSPSAAIDSHIFRFNQLNNRYKFDTHHTLLTPLDGQHTTEELGFELPFPAVCQNIFGIGSHVQKNQAQHRNKNPRRIGRVRGLTTRQFDISRAFPLAMSPLVNGSSKLRRVASRQTKVRK